MKIEDYGKWIALSIDNNFYHFPYNLNKISSLIKTQSKIKIMLWENDEKLNTIFWPIDLINLLIKYNFHENNRIRFDWSNYTFKNYN